MGQAGDGADGGGTVRGGGHRLPVHDIPGARDHRPRDVVRRQEDGRRLHGVVAVREDVQEDNREEDAPVHGQQNPAGGHRTAHSILRYHGCQPRHYGPLQVPSRE